MDYQLKHVQEQRARRELAAKAEAKAKAQAPVRAAATSEKALPRAKSQAQVMYFRGQLARLQKGLPLTMKGNMSREEI